MPVRPEQTPTELWRRSKPQTNDSAATRVRRIAVHEGLFRARAFAVPAGVLGWLAVIAGVDGGFTAAEGIAVPAVVFGAASAAALRKAYHEADALPPAVEPPAIVEDAAPTIEDTPPSRVAPPAEPTLPPTSN